MWAGRECKFTPIKSEPICERNNMQLLRLEQ